MVRSCRIAIAVVLAGPAAACSFSAGAAPDAGVLAPDSSTDATIDMPDGSPPSEFCDVSGPSLVGCWEFETNTNDGSGQGNNATPIGTSYAAGKIGQGLVLQASSSVTLPDTASMSPPTLTIEAWIKPSALPTGGARMGIVDNDGSYGFFLYEGTVQCTVSVAVTAVNTIGTDQWTHVACTFDGTRD